MTDHPAGPGCYRHPDRETYIACQRCGRPICPDCMRDAAVGFQCPDCVSEGAKQTRQAGAAYGGARSANPQTTSLVLIGINVAVWVAVMAGGGNSSRLLQWLVLRGESVCARGNLAFRTDGLSCAGNGTLYPGVSDGAWWQLATSMFTHVEVWHIGFNMLALWVLGPQLEAVIGRARFLALYLISGLGGSVLVYLVVNPIGSTLGASGAIFGLMAGLLVIGHKIGANVQPILMWVGINFLLTFTLSGISWQGHLGGFITGGVVAGILAYAPRERRTQLQVAGLAAVVVVLAVLTAIRTTALL